MIIYGHKSYAKYHNQGQLAGMYTHHNSGLLWDSLATLPFLMESRAHASAKTGPITSCTTQQVSGSSHLVTVIVVQVSISMQTKPLPLPLLNEINTQLTLTPTKVTVAPKCTH